MVAVWLRPHGDRPIGTPMQFPLDAPPGQLYQLALSPDGKQLAATSDEELTEPRTAPLGVTVGAPLDRPGWQRLPGLHARLCHLDAPQSRLMYAAEDGLRSIHVELCHLANRRASSHHRRERDDRLGDVRRILLIGGSTNCWASQCRNGCGRVADRPERLVRCAAPAARSRQTIPVRTGRQSGNGDRRVPCRTTSPLHASTRPRASNVSLKTSGEAYVYGIDQHILSQAFDARTGAVYRQPRGSDCHSRGSIERGDGKHRAPQAHIGRSSSSPDRRHWR